jgi:hypothetical protein
MNIVDEDEARFEEALGSVGRSWFTEEYRPK